MAPAPRAAGDTATGEASGANATRVERFDRRGTEPFEPFEPFELFQNRISFSFFFGRRRLKKRSEKTEIARSKRKHRKRKREGGKRPRGSAAPSTWSGNVVELAGLKFTRVGHK